MGNRRDCFTFIYDCKTECSQHAGLVAGCDFRCLYGRYGSELLVQTITKGAGSTLGGVGLIIVLGAALGQLMTDCGASKKIADTMVAHCGARTLRWGVMLVGVIFGISMFFEVGFMVVVPLVVSIAREAKIPYMYLIIPVLAGVAQGHSVFPPQPGPVALVDAFGADSGMVYLLGLVVVIPSVICAGIILPRFLNGLDKLAAPNLGEY